MIKPFKGIEIDHGDGKAPQEFLCVPIIIGEDFDFTTLVASINASLSQKRDSGILWEIQLPITGIEALHPLWMKKHLFFIERFRRFLELSSQREEPIEQLFLLSIKGSWIDWKAANAFFLEEDTYRDMPRDFVKILAQRDLFLLLFEAWRAELDCDCFIDMELPLFSSLEKKELLSFLSPQTFDSWRLLYQEELPAHFAPQNLWKEEFCGGMRVWKKLAGKAKIALCCGGDPFLDPYMEDFINLLEKAGQDYRLITEDSFHLQWDSLDHIILTQESLSLDLGRSCRGFCAAGGELITIQGDFALPNERSWEDFWRDI